MTRSTLGVAARTTLALALGATLVAGCSGVAPFAPGARPVASAGSVRYVKQLDIPPRLQWLANDGYCGETSLISAGLYYGQYTSQYTARAVDGSGYPQASPRSQLLLDRSAEVAANAMHLRWKAWPYRRDQNHGMAKAFLAWVKAQVLSGHPVTIGVYENEALLEGTPPDPQYDHIVPVVAIASYHPLNDVRYYPDDQITFSDNGLKGFLPKPGHTRPLSTFLNTYGFGSFPLARGQANAQDAPWYSLAKTAGDFGIAILGIVDPDHETLPVRVATNKIWEYPYMVDGSNKRPRPEPLALKVTVSALTPGIRYNLYRYKNFASVPKRHFNRYASAAVERWSIRIAHGSTFQLRQNIMSDQTVVYRAVPASAP